MTQTLHPAGANPHPSYYRSQVDSLHDRWVSTLRDLRSISEPSARELYIADLVELYSQADKLLSHQLHNIDAIRAIKLRHIVERDLSGHIAIARHLEGAVMSDYRNPYIPNPNDNY